MMIAAMANAACVFGKPDWLDAAVSAFAFIRDRMQSEGRLLHSFRAGKPKHAATLDDYANMTRAAVSLHEATGNADYIDTARKWIGVIDTHFWDRRGDTFLRPTTPRL